MNSSSTGHWCTSHWFFMRKASRPAVWLSLPAVIIIFASVWVYDELGLLAGVAVMLVLVVILRLCYRIGESKLSKPDGRRDRRRP